MVEVNITGKIKIAIEIIAEFITLFLSKSKSNPILFIPT